MKFSMFDNIFEKLGKFYTKPIFFMKKLAQNAENHTRMCPRSRAGEATAGTYSATGSTKKMKKFQKKIKIFNIFFEKFSRFFSEKKF